MPIVITNWNGFDYLLKGSAITKAIRIGANRAAAKVKPALIEESPIDLGYLKKSIRIKVILERKPKNGIIVKVGPGSTLVYKKGKYKHDTKRHKKGDPILHKPARYVHLAERHWHHTARVQSEAESWFYAAVQKEITAEIRKAETMVQ